MSGKIAKTAGIWAVLLCLFPLTAVAAGPPIAGDILPDRILLLPKDGGARSYLGLSGSETFRIRDLKAQAVIIQIYSMYCPYCQREAPIVNELYEKIEANPQTRGKIKLLGIGVGNSLFEVDVYRKKYKVSFPLIPDSDFAIHRAYGEPRTPYFMVVKTDTDGVSKVLYAKLGALEGVDAFLDRVVRLTPY